MLKSFENFSEFAGGSGKEGESGEKKPGLEPMEGVRPVNEDKQNDDRGRFRFYYDRKKPTEDSQIKILDPKVIEAAKEVIMKDREPRDYKELPKDPEVKEDIAKSRELIMRLGKKLKLDFSDRLYSDNDIHLLEEDEFNKRFTEEVEFLHGRALSGETFIKYDNSGEEDQRRLLRCNIQHEMLHSAVMKKIFMKEDFIKM